MDSSATAQNFNKQGVVSIWIGSFPTEEAFDTYIDWIYNEDGESTNQFAADSGIYWFDHDFQEASFYANGLGTPTDALKGNSYESSFFSEAKPLLQRKITPTDNAILLLYDYTYSYSMAEVAERSGCKLKYVGTFPYSK